MAKRDLHQLWIRTEHGICMRGRVRLPEHKKHCVVYVFLAFYHFRTQQALLLQCVSCFLCFQNTSLLYFDNVFHALYFPRTQKLYLVNVFMLFMLLENKKYILSMRFMFFMRLDQKQPITCQCSSLERRHAPISPSRRISSRNTNKHEHHGQNRCFCILEKQKTWNTLTKHLVLCWENIKT